jgi:hypothetical protein
MNFEIHLKKKVINLKKYDLTSENFTAKIANYIKSLFKKGTHFITIKNNNSLNNKDLTGFYETINHKIGIMREIDKDKYKDEYKVGEKNYWVDIKYDSKVNDIKPWKSNLHLKLHTDNTISLEENYAQITELICLEPCKYSGLTTIINNNLVIELIKYVDKLTNDNLFTQIYEREIFHTSNCINHYKSKILRFDNFKNEFIFSFNYTQAIKSFKNSDEEKEIIIKLNHFLEEKIMLSNLMSEIKLDIGDALLFNDEIVLHGRRSVIGNRFYKKCSIFLS